MGLSEAGHLYNPAPRSWHWLRSKCSSTFANPACVAAEGSDVEHPPSANSPSTAIAEIARFAILSKFEPEFRLSIEAPPIGLDEFCDPVVEAGAPEGPPPLGSCYSPVPL